METGTTSLHGVLVEQGFCFFNSRNCEIVGLEPIRVVLPDHKIQSGGVQEADDDHREEHHAPEDTDQDGAGIRAIGSLDLACEWVRKAHEINARVSAPGTRWECWGWNSPLPRWGGH